MFRCLIASAGFLLLLAPAVFAAERPNVIIIYSDDQGFGDASCLNPDAKFQTPNLDRLAAEGLTFTNGHSADSVCTPSRYALLTGRYAWRTRLKKGVMGAEGQCLISDGTATIASILRQAGYATSMVGKWHLGMDFPGESYKQRDWTQPVRDMPLDKGFDYFFGVPASLNYGVLAWFEGRYAKVPPTRFTNKKPNDRHVDYRIMPPYESTPEETKELVGRAGMEVAPDFIDNECLTRFTDKAIEWIKRHQGGGRKDDPFFLYLPLTSPHYPVCPLPQFHGKGQCGGYGEFVIETDHHVGRVLDYLESAGLDDDTLIIYTSDNGPEKSWQQRVKEFGHRSNFQYRQGKRSIYEGGHRVPFFVRWPAGIANPGSRWSRPVGQVDLLATIAQLAGAQLEADQAVDSQSFATVLMNPVSNYQRTPLINHGAKGRFSVTHDHWKLIMPHGKLERELYDLEADPGEMRNVIKQHPDVAARLEAQITEIVLNGRSRTGPKQSNDTEHWKDLTWIKPWPTDE
ncbi:MAG: arylsulfatase [Planctomycetota bacterium]